MSLLLIPAWRRSRRPHTTSWQAARKLTTASWTSWWERPVARVCSAPSGRSTAPPPTRPYSRPFFVKSTERSPSRRADGQPHTKTVPIRSLPAADDTRSRHQRGRTSSSGTGSALIHADERLPRTPVRHLLNSGSLRWLAADLVSQETELVTFRVGQYVPSLIAVLTDI